MKKSVEQVKKGALLVAFASLCSSPVMANGTTECSSHTQGSQSTHEAQMQQTEGKAHLASAHQKHEKLEAPLVVLTDSEKNKLQKGQVAIGTADKPNGRRWVTAKIKINAQPSVVWEAVHEERKTDPDLAYSKILEEVKNEAGKNEQTLEQKFQLIPVLGTSVCVIKSTEDLHKRIDYHLLKSDRFKAVEGSWLLQPTEDGGTVLELGSYIDIGVPAPRSFVENIAGKKLERRLTNVRKVAENHTSKTPLAQRGGEVN